jgi:putative salt-induced outer membrane protein
MKSAVVWLALFLTWPSRGLAQTPAPPPEEGWAGSIAAGLSVTGGNTATTTTNLSFTVESDRTMRNVFRAEGLNIRSSRDGAAIVDRTSLQAQDDYALTTRVYALGRMQYLRDVFKGIDYLIAPTAGVGYKAINTPSSSLNVDVAVGTVTEKNPGAPTRTSGALTLGEKVSHKLTSTATLTESLSALWKTSDFEDSLLTFQVGLATDITPRMQFKADFLDTYKNRPPSVLVKKNDLALLLSFVFKF